MKWSADTQKNESKRRSAERITLQVLERLTPACRGRRAMETKIKKSKRTNTRKEHTHHTFDDLGNGLVSLERARRVTRDDYGRPQKTGRRDLSIPPRRDIKAPR